MKTITIRLPDVEAAMMRELQKRCRISCDKLIIDLIKFKYEAEVLRVRGRQGN